MGVCGWLKAQHATLGTMAFLLNWLSAVLLHRAVGVVLLHLAQTAGSAACLNKYMLCALVLGLTVAFSVVVLLTLHDCTVPRHSIAVYPANMPYNWQFKKTTLTECYVSTLECFSPDPPYLLMMSD